MALYIYIDDGVTPITLVKDWTPRNVVISTLLHPIP
jgi:hypothetical protein